MFCPWRFHSPAKEAALTYDVILPVDDAVQLSVVQYRNKLYEVRKWAKMYFIIIKAIFCSLCPDDVREKD